MKKIILILIVLLVLTSITIGHQPTKRTVRTVSFIGSSLAAPHMVIPRNTEPVIIEDGKIISGDIFTIKELITGIRKPTKANVKEIVTGIPKRLRGVSCLEKDIQQ